MKQSWKLRCIFIFACIGITLYLGFRTNKLILKDGQGYKEYNLVINEAMVNNRSSLRDEDGDFEGWVEIYNKGDTAENLQGFGLSNDSKQPFLWTFPNIILEPKAYCIVWTSAKNKNVPEAPLHTNFNLKNKDKVAILSAPNSKWNDIFLFEPMDDNISYGRMPDGSTELYGFDEGTPGKANVGEAMIEGTSTKRLEGPIFSHLGGFYTEAFDLMLRTNTDNAIIYYTLDGSVPTRESKAYTEPIFIPLKTNAATVVRARVYKDGYPKSEIITQSYFVEKNVYDAYNTPVISLVTDPENLFDYEKGIYVAGKIFDEWKADNPNSEVKKYTPANYNQRGKNWERPASIELFVSDGTLGIKQNIGVRISGDTSRANRVKSFSLRARNNYDNIEYFLFDFFDGKSKKMISDEQISQFSRILLRSSGTDSEGSFFRDAFIQSLITTPMILDTQSSKPCILYMNGKYYGIRNIREDYDKSYINNHYGIDEKNVVIIKNPTGIAGVEVQEGYVGDEMYYNQMISFLEEHDSKSDAAYNFIKAHMDIDNYIEYNVLQIYSNNDDWPGGNVSIWRKRTQAYEPNASYGHDGRWRWLVCDLDHGFGLLEGEEAAKSNSLERATAKNGPEWPNPPWSTFLLRSLLENNEFKNQFINVFADRLNTSFSTESVIEKLEAMKEIYYPNVENHILRWDLYDNKIENWLNEIELMKNFAVERPKYLRQYIAEYFDLSGTAAIRLEMNEGGTIKINSLNIEHADNPWEGIYFKGIPVTVEAIPKPGFVFVGWEGVNTSHDKAIKIKLQEASYLKAVFKSDKNN